MAVDRYRSMEILFYGALAEGKSKTQAFDSACRILKPRPREGTKYPLEFVVCNSYSKAIELYLAHLVLDRDINPDKCTCIGKLESIVK